MKRAQIVIVGGGFGGVACAKTLRKHLSPKTCDITLFDYQNHMVFHPLLAEVVGATLRPDAAAVPLRQMLPTVECRTEPIMDIDFRHQRVKFISHEAEPDSLGYDHIVMAAGSVVDLRLVPGMADFAFPLKTIADAMDLRSHVIEQLEKADVAPTHALRRDYLTFVVVGGGFSGIEVAGEINDFARESVRYFHHLKASDIHVKIIHSRDRILPEISASLGDFAFRKMQKAGITFILNARAQTVFSDRVVLENGETIKAGTIVSTVGNVPAPVTDSLAQPKEKHALITEADMRLAGQPHAWAIGDCARITNAYDGKLCPTTAQFAEREGRQVAENIVRVLNGKATKPFYHRPLGQLCSIGGKRAVADIMGFKISGFIAWFVWRGVYLLKMPTWSRRIKIGFDWAWDLIFHVDLVYFRVDRTTRR